MTNFNYRGRVQSAPVDSQAVGNNNQATDGWLTDEVVTVIVGYQEKRWTVHEKLLVSQSEFFRSHFAQENVTEMRLPREDPRLFAIFIRWLYGTAFVPSGGPRNFRYLPPDGLTHSVRDYLGVYVMGGTFGITGVRNAVVDVLHGYFGPGNDSHRAPDIADVTYLFSNTTEGTPMRRFLAAHMLFHMFSKHHTAAGLPKSWKSVLQANSDIGCEMLDLLGTFGWAMGQNVPRMTIKPRSEFHERAIDPQQPGVKTEDEEYGSTSSLLP
ncbi:hypothetical protein B0J18DRAFT_210424 [Chaetomium sp. MPI-SDFR-AT-0129]|nr:hypothetical protein B0J18DRAFT_210424 [Chaetomium sp. MPI-SDFR-AT-0129]